MKTGRNDLCPCGSGKKYKKCCLLKEDETQLQTDDKEWEEWFKKDCELGAKLLAESEADLIARGVIKST